MHSTRVFPTQEPDLSSCHWIHHAAQPAAPLVGAFRCVFATTRKATIRIHVSADERYRLWLNGEAFGRGPERGDLEEWPYETYDLTLPAGQHTLVARVWAQGERAPYAQIGLKSGFFCAPEEDEWRTLLGTGIAPWQSQLLDGYEFLDPIAAWGTGDNIQLDGARFPWGFESGLGDNWQDCVKGLAAITPREAQNVSVQHLLRPATLPPMIDQPVPAGRVRLVSSPEADDVAKIPLRAQDNIEAEASDWQALFDGVKQPVVIPAHSRRRVILDLENYYCAYPEAQVSGGAGSRIRLHWQEAPFQEIWKVDKGNRNEIEGKFFVPAWNDRSAVCDVFLPDGGASRRFDTLWWQCGRYVEILVETADEPLCIESIHFQETRYPMEMESSFASSDERLTEIVPIMVRGLQMCSHETYMDCPFYEQLMYIGDTRLQALTTYIMSTDTRLPRKALSLFNASRLRSGLTQSRYPSRVRQTIAPFSLWYAAMVHDFYMWRDDEPFVRELMPGVRGIIDFFVRHVAQQGEYSGLLLSPDGWNYVDWVKQWKSGEPPDAAEGSHRPSGALNWQFALVLNQVAELEENLGEPELAARARRLSAQLATRLKQFFWNEERGLFADDTAHEHFSQHSQSLAILSGHLGEKERERVGDALIQQTGLARASIYFSYYLFEAYRAVGRSDAFLKDLDLWFELVANGLKTTVEMPEPTRSDCHAWGAHPLFHYHATLAGVRPSAPGFEKVKITPQPAGLTWLRSRTPHPRGEIVLDLQQDGTSWRGEITLPDGITGELTTRSSTIALTAGTQTLQELEL